MEPAAARPEPAPADKRRGRRVFFAWFLALLGVGTGMLAVLLVGSGEVGWSSPVILGNAPPR